MKIFLQTERLIFRELTENDLDDAYALRSDPDVMRFSTTGAQSKSQVQTFLEKAIAYQQKHGFGLYALYEKTSADFVGIVGLFHPAFDDTQPDIEIGYRLHKKFWGKGYATEATKALIQWTFQHLALPKIVAFIDVDNQQSHRVILKSGMQSTGMVNCVYGYVMKYEIYKDNNKKNIRR